MHRRLRVLVSWSSGKDCAWSLHELRQRDDVEIVGLMTTINSAADRVAMHAVRRDLVELQAQRVGLPLWTSSIPSPCSNDEYERAMARIIDRARSEGIDAFAFGDLFLEDVRKYREEKLLPTGLKPIFPLWKRPTRDLSRQMIDAGLRAVLTCVDPKRLAKAFVGRDYDDSLLRDLPNDVDPCGENGEFHTFAYAGPMFREPIDVRVGDIVERDGFVFADVFSPRP